MSQSTTQIVIIVAALGGVLALLTIGLAIAWPRLVGKRRAPRPRQRNMKGVSLATMESGLFGSSVGAKETSVTGLVSRDSQDTHPYNPWARSQSRSSFRSQSSISTLPPSHSTADLSYSSASRRQNQPILMNSSLGKVNPSILRNELSSPSAPLGITGIMEHHTGVKNSAGPHRGNGSSPGIPLRPLATPLPLAHQSSAPILSQPQKPSHLRRLASAPLSPSSPPPRESLPGLPDVPLTPMDERVMPESPATPNSIWNDPTPDPIPLVYPPANSSQASLRPSLAPLLIPPPFGPRSHPGQGAEAEVSRWSATTADTASAYPSSRVLPSNTSSGHGQTFSVDPSAPAVPMIPSVNVENSTPLSFSPYPEGYISPQTPRDPGNRASDARIQDWSPGGIFTAARVVSDVPKMKLHLPSEM
ncbi:hypothetical protein DL96DRAFT_239925 [Flagelloscypha sp. PMI_526]|nr:hypothetical protein DL96DRAFT_239925 [Flagelloscypha sp. PMI_526]